MPAAGSYPLTDVDVLDYMQGFAGYGNLGAAVWYVGMEEAGVANAEQAQRRISVWRDFGSLTVDLREYHRLIDDFRCFGERPEHQATWRGLIRIDRAFRGLDTNPADVLRHQQQCWGRSSGDQCLLELYPLPKQSLAAWDYDKWVSLPELRDPEKYYAARREPRLRLLASLLSENRPSFVVFYGKKYLSAWEELAGGPFEASDDLPPRAAGFRRGPHTTFVAIDHTVARGWKNEHFAAVGIFMRRWRMPDG